MQKSIITPDFEKKECVPPFRESLHQLKKQRRVSEELIMPPITKQALVESPVLGLCAYAGLTGSGVINCNLVSSLSHPVKSHPFSHQDSEVKDNVLGWYKSIINNSADDLLIIRVIEYTF